MGERRKNPAAGLAALAVLLAGAMALPLTRGAPVVEPAPAPVAKAAPGPKAKPAKRAPLLPITPGDVASFRELDFVATTVTGYSSSREETDDTPFETATLTATRPGIIALSRDLLRSFNDDAPFDYGDYVLLSGIGIFRVEDTMNARWTHRADIWFPSQAQARQWGRRTALMARVAAPEADGMVANEDHLDTILEGF